MDTSKQFVADDINDDNQQQQQQQQQNNDNQNSDDNQQQQNNDNQQQNDDNQNQQQSDDNSNSTSITIEDENGDSKEYSIDENGNATFNGEVVYTKQELIDNGFKFDNEDDNIHKSLSDLSGIELNDSDGKPLVFKDGLEGLAEREVKVKDTFYNKGKEEAITKFYEENPDVYEMMSYKQRHGSLDNFTNRVDYSKLLITAETTTDVLKSVYKDYLTKLGNDEDTVEKLLKLSENDETLRIDATKALSKLNEFKSEEDKLYNDSLIEQEIQYKKQYQQKYGIDVNEKGEIVDLNIKDSMYDKIVKQGKVGNIAIPKDGLTIKRDGKDIHLNKTDIFAYFYNPIETENGTFTLAQLDEYKRTNNIDNWIVQGIKNLVGDDINKLEKALGTVIKMNSTKKLIKIVGTSSSNNSNQNNSKSTGKKRVVLD